LIFKLFPESDSEEEEEDLLEDDEDLLEENLGISVKKRKRRVQLGSDSEEENEKQDLEKQLFEGGEVWCFKHDILFVK